MSNVHRLGDYQNLPDSNEQRVQWGPPQDTMDKIPFFNMRGNDSGNPKEEGFCKMLYVTFCPRLKLLSLTACLVAINVIMFALTLALGGINMSGSFLQAQYEEMNTLGAMNQQELKDGQIYRIVTPIFLHWNFMHIFFNSLAMLCCMSIMEKAYGVWVTLGLYLIGGVGGNIFSALLQSWDPFLYSAGASTSIFAIIGAWISFMILNWRGLKNTIGQEFRCMMILMVMMNVIMIWMFSSVGGYGAGGVDSEKGSPYNNIDNYGHLGGFLTGIFVGLWLPAPIEKSSWTNGTKFVGIALTSTFFVLSFSLFFATKG